MPAPATRRDTGRSFAVDETINVEEVGVMRTHVFCMAAGLAAIAAGGCGGADKVDRTGHAAESKPVTLTLANHESDPSDVADWVEAVQRLTHGSLKIDVSNDW